MSVDMFELFGVEVWDRIAHESPEDFILAGLKYLDKLIANGLIVAAKLFEQALDIVFCWHTGYRPTR